MRLLVSLVVALVAVTALAADDKKDPIEQQRKAILKATNEFRKSNKLPPLTLDEKLTEAAQGHANNLAKQDKYGDDNRNPHVLDGKNAEDRVKAAGYEGKATRENIARMNAAAGAWQRAMAAWKKSTIHRTNLLATDVDEIGIGLAQSNTGSWYFCQVFSSPTERRALLQFKLENKTNKSIEVQFSWEKEGRTVKPNASQTFECRVGTPEEARLTVL